MAEFYMTQKGYDKMRAELDYMERHDVPALLERIASARAEGDLSENAEYHGSREQLGLLEAKMSEIRYKLSVAEIVDESKLPSDEVAFGCTVLVRNQDDESERSFTIVGLGEENPREGKIQVTCPLAQGLVGKKVGEVAEVEVPIGTLRLEILEISREG